MSTPQEKLLQHFRLATLLQNLYQFYMRLRSIRVAAIHELPLQCVFLHQSYKAHLQTELVLLPPLTKGRVGVGF